MRALRLFSFSFLALYRAVKYLLWWLLALLVLVIIAGWYFTATNSGYKKLPALLAEFTPYQLRYDTLRGTLFGRQEWTGFALTGPGIDWQAQKLIFDWQSMALWQKKLIVRDLIIEDATLNLLPLPASEDTPSAPPQALPEINLPIAVAVQNVALKRVDVQQNAQPVVNIAAAQLHATYERAKLQGEGQIASDKGAGEVHFDLTTTGDYPVDLRLQGDTPLLNPPQKIAVEWQKSLLTPQITVALTGAVAAKATLAGAIDLPAQKLNAALHWQDVAYQKNYRSAAGDLTLNGAWTRLHANLNGQFAGDNLPPATLSATADILPQGIEDAKIVLHALGGQADFQGKVNYGAHLAWQGVLNLQHIDGKKFDPKLDLRLDGTIATTGTQQGDNLQAVASIKNLQGQWQGQPIAGKGDIHYDKNKLDIKDLDLQLAGNRLSANGQADGEQADLRVNLAAPALGRIVPHLSGDVNGQAHITGNLSTPNITGQVQWKNLTYGAAKSPLFASPTGQINATGDLDKLLVKVNAKAHGQDFPPLSVTGKTTLLPRSKAKDLQLEVQTLQGKIDLTGEVAYAPTLQWQINAQAAGLDPRYFAPDLRATLNADLSSTGNIVAGKPHLRAEIKRLTGQWQKQALTGAGVVTIDGDKINAQKLFVTVGNNRVALDGGLTGQKIALNFALQGSKLAAFYPQLAGSLHGQGTVSGTLHAPQITTQLQGQNLVFADNKIAKLTLNVDSALQKNSPFNNHIVLQGVSAGGQKWQTIQLDTQGRYNQHNLKMQTAGGVANVQLAGSGGFSALDTWQGVLAALNIRGDKMDWRLQKSAALKFSPQDLFVKNFCLQDRFSGLCLNVAKNKQTVIDYNIRQISPQSFAPFIPNNIALKTALKGAGKVTLLPNGQLRGTANLFLTPGTVSVFSDNQPPLVLKVQKATLNAQFSDKAAKSDVLLDLGDSGLIKGNALMSDYQRQNIAGEISVNVPKLAQFKKFVPKVSELNGKINGLLQFRGTVKNPIVSGDMRLSNGVVKIPEYATDLKDIRLDLAAHKTGQIDIKGNVGTPEGNLTTTGDLFLSPLKLNLQMKGKNMLVADSKEMKVTISPDFLIVINPKTGINVKGKVLIPKASIALPDTSGGESISEDVTILSKKKKPTAITTSEDSPLRADVAIVLGDKVFFKTSKVNIRLKGGIDVLVRPGQQVAAKGSVEVASGVYELYGQELDIRRGRVSFAGGDITNPTVDVLALREVDNVAVGAAVKGPAHNLQLKLTSTPSMPDSAILSYLLFGRPPDGAMDKEALLQMAASLSLGSILPDDLAEKTGLDVFDIGVNGLKAGKYLTKDLYVGLRNNFFTGITKFIARYQFTNRFNVEATAQQQSKSIDFLYEFEKD